MPPFRPKTIISIRNSYPSFPVDPSNDAEAEFARLVRFNQWQENSDVLRRNYRHLFGREYVGTAGPSRTQTESQITTAEQTGEATQSTQCLTPKQLKVLCNKFPRFEANPTANAHDEFNRLARTQGWASNSAPFRSNYKNLFGKTYPAPAAQHQTSPEQQLANLADVLASLDMGRDSGSNSFSGENDNAPAAQLQALARQQLGDLPDVFAHLEVSGESGSDLDGIYAAPSSSSSGASIPLYLGSPSSTDGSGVLLNAELASPYFSSDPKFTPRPRAPFRTEFGRFASCMGWRKKTPKYQHELGVAMSAEFDFLCGGKGTPLSVLQEICRDLVGDTKGKGVPGSLTGCRKVSQPGQYIDHGTNEVKQKRLSYPSTCTYSRTWIASARAHPSNLSLRA